MLNNGTNRLDYIITSGKTFGNHNGIGFKGETFGFKIIFIKSSLLIDLVDQLKGKFVIGSVTTEGKHAEK